jgi:Undecaprenyl-phosphate galactose phosphotransferase WbaP
MKLLRRASAIAIMLLFDAGAISLSYYLAYLLRGSLLLHLFPGMTAPLSFELFVQRFYLLAIYFLVFAYEGLYVRRLVFREEVLRILRGTMLGAVLVIMALYVTRTYALSRSVVLVATVVIFVVLPAARTIAKRIVIALRLWSKSVIIVGADRNTEVFKAELAHNWRLGYVVTNPGDSEFATLPSSADLPALLGRTRAETFVLSDASVSREAMVDFLRVAESLCEEVIVLPDSRALGNVAVDIEQLESLLLMKYRYSLLQPVNALIKRLVEVPLGFVLLLLFSPVFALVAVAIAVDSPGPVFLAQERIGWGQRRFRCIKFRTMWQDAEQRLQREIDANPKAREEWDKYRWVSNDPRVTRVGRLMRRLSIDELPQFLNVLRGEMSLVGPRPRVPEELLKIGSFLSVITHVRPGMTGLTQVSGRKGLTYDERLSLDEHYVRNWSLWMDTVILLRTVRVVIRGDGAL